MKYLVLLFALSLLAPDGPFTYLPLLHGGTAPLPIQISALYYDTYLTGEPDEAFQLYNPLPRPVSLAGWRVTAGSRTVIFPSGIEIAPHAQLWCARQAIDFRQSFAFTPGCEYGADTDPVVPNLTGGALTLANTGGRVTLTNPERTYQDVLVYEAGDTGAGSGLTGWQGPAVEPYRPTRSFGAEGQILYRKLDQATGLPVPDTDTLADWAQDPADVIDGRRVQYPGWDLARFFFSPAVTETAALQVIIAPDHAFDALAALLQAAQARIQIEVYTFESARLADIVAERARAGVQVELLLEGAPAGGVTDQQRWIVRQLSEAGARVAYLRSRPELDIADRYSYQHAKFLLLDERLALVGSENLSPDAFPDDPKADGTLGRRGLYFVTDAPSVVTRLAAILAADSDPAHRDVWAWDPQDAQLGAPPADFQPDYLTGGISYPVRFPASLLLHDTFTFQVVQAPENALADRDGWLALVNRAGAGDIILLEALDEPPFWGPSDSNAAQDPNPRLEAYIGAARRGATVRVLLDAFFDNQDLDNPRSNLRTIEYVKAVAQVEGLDLDARRGNPTGRGIHNKMLLARVGGEGWVMAGSLNGGETSSKLNREVSLFVRSAAAYDYLAALFWSDWQGGS